MKWFKNEYTNWKLLVEVPRAESMFRIFGQVQYWCDLDLLLCFHYTQLPSVQEVVGRTSIGRQFPTSVDGRRRVRNESSVDGRKTTSPRRRKQTSIWRPELTSRWRRISTVDRRLICDVITTVARRPFSTSILRPSSTSNWRPHLTGYSRSLLTWFSTSRFNLLLYFL